MTGDIHELNLHSTSRAADGASLAAIDVAEVADEHALEYRIVGGNAVTLLTVVHRVDHLVPGRETADADFGAPFPVVADPRLPAGLAARGYDCVEGNRFQRMRPDDKGELLLVVDVLAPAYEYRLKPNQRHGDLVVDEVPGLPLALARPPTTVALDLTLTGGERLSAVIRLPDVVAALCLESPRLPRPHASKRRIGHLAPPRSACRTSGSASVVWLHGIAFGAVCTWRSDYGCLCQARIEGVPCNALEILVDQ